MAKKALGKGLGALISSSNNSSKSPTKTALQNTTTEGSASSTEAVTLAELSDIVASPLQPRREFKPEALRDLVESIKERGVIQPLIARPVGDHLELIAGERRWRASREAGLKQVPVIIRDASDQDVLEMALVENLQRQDLNPIEEAAGYARLAREFSLKQEEIAARVGKSRASVANAMRLLDLTPELQDWIFQGKLSVGHAKVILSLKDDAQRHLVAEQVLQRQLTVRQTERLVQEVRSGKFEKPKAIKPQPEPDPLFARVSHTLSEQLATPVAIQAKGKKGKIEIDYRNRKELIRILELLGIDSDEMA